MKTKISQTDGLTMWLKKNYGHRLTRSIYTNKTELDGTVITRIDTNSIWVKACKALGKVYITHVRELIAEHAVEYIPVTEHLNGIRIQYGRHLGKPVIVLPQIFGEPKTEHCPWCYTNHMHALCEGHRAGHCGDIRRGSRRKNIEVLKHPDGTLLFRADGYFIKHVERSSKINLI